MSGVMPGTGNSSYAGYFKNTQAVGGACGLYAEAYTALYAKGNIQIDGGALTVGINGALFYRNSGTTYLQSAPGEGLFLVSQSGRLINSITGSAWGLTINTKTSGTNYVLGVGGVDYVGGYRAEFTTATF
jgi:hypothetical protein